jgi:hypothetical protein
MSTEALLKLIADRKAATSRLKTMKPNPGRNRYRILPGWRKSGDPQFYHDFGQHFIKNAAGEFKAVYICTDKTFGRPCAICDSVGQAIRNSKSDSEKKLFEEARSNGRVLVNALHIDGPTPNEVQILELAPSAFNGKKGVGGIISLFTDWPDLLDPIKGSDIIIERSGTGKETAYGVSAVPGKPLDPKILEKLQDLDKFVQQESEQAQVRALGVVATLSGLPAPTLAALPQPKADIPQPAPIVVAPAATETAPVIPAAATTAAPAPQPQPAPVVAAVAAAAPAANASSTGDAELDALLRDLGTG